MQSTRFLVLLFWASGRRTSYCARAWDGGSAVAAAQADTQGDLADITATAAYPWPAEMGGPNAPRQEGKAYKLRSREFVDRLLTQLADEDSIIPTGRPLNGAELREAGLSIGGSGPGRGAEGYAS